ncbi:hypothetical protein [Sulfurospirillum oryzae]|uniref:hypothetical protein n=1 Tax=Sulfurospirillum oryzae TaxID=2976535 RepID=UPI0021E803E0|nr:hypothetical protein [Sulfurospirillum oryzae]
MKAKEIASIFGVPQSTLNEWKKEGHSKKVLADFLTNVDKESILNLYKSATAYDMLVSTVNTSIGNENKHLGAHDIKKLLMGKIPQNPLEKYALDIIKTEALKVEIEDFASHFKIPMKKVNKVLNDGY